MSVNQQRQERVVRVVVRRAESLSLEEGIFHPGAFPCFPFVIGPLLSNGEEALHSPNNGVEIESVLARRMAERDTYFDHTMEVSMI